MAPELCINCKRAAVHIKKRQLCSYCYQTLYRKKKTTPEWKSAITGKEYHHIAEIEFVKNYPLPENLIYLPCQFKFNHTSYQPDFYDCKKNIFYEIIGTRQAFEQNHAKIEQFKLAYPHIKLEFIRDYQRN